MPHRNWVCDLKVRWFWCLKYMQRSNRRVHLRYWRPLTGLSKYLRSRMYNPSISIETTLESACALQKQYHITHWQFITRWNQVTVRHSLTSWYVNITRSIANRHYSMKYWGQKFPSGWSVLNLRILTLNSSPTCHNTLVQKLYFFLNEYFSALDNIKVRINIQGLTKPIFI